MVSYKKLLVFVAVFFSAVVLVATPVKADLTGSSMSWQYYAYGGAYTDGTTSGTFVVPGGGGKVGTFIGSTIPFFYIDANATSITFDYSAYTGAAESWASSALSLSPTIYNGIAIDMVSGPAFTSVTIDPSTNMAGFGANNVSFTSGQIEVDWANLPFSNSTIVELDINAAAVPEPTTMLLLGLGLIGLAGVRRKIH